MIPNSYSHYQIDVDHCGIPLYIAYPMEKIGEVDGWKARYCLINYHDFCVGIYTWKELKEKFPHAEFIEISHTKMPRVEDVKVTPQLIKGYIPKRKLDKRNPPKGGSGVKK